MLQQLLIAAIAENEAVINAFDFANSIGETELLDSEFCCDVLIVAEGLIMKKLAKKFPDLYVYDRVTGRVIKKPEMTKFGEDDCLVIKETNLSADELEDLNTLEKEMEKESQQNEKTTKQTVSELTKQMKEWNVELKQMNQTLQQNNAKLSAMHFMPKYE